MPVNKNVIFRGVLWLSSLAAVSGCEREPMLEKIVSWNDNEIIITVDDLNTGENGQGKASIVYGSLLFRLKYKQPQSVNLNCIAVSVHGLESTDIYVDRVAHVLTEPYLVNDPDSRIPVYWTMHHVITRKQFDSGFRVYVKDNCKLVVG